MRHRFDWRELSQSATKPASPEERRARFSALLARYDAGAGKLPALVKVTGTSGKGSVAAMLEAALIADGKRVGLFTSPHLIDVTERIRILGSDIGAEELDAAAERVAARLDGHRPELRPSFFEVLLLLALDAFVEHRVEVAIVEVAIGGRHDVVSLLSAPLALVTSVGLDHGAELGASIAAVAADKAGIANPGTTLVLGPRLPAEALRVIRDDASRRRIRVVEASPAGLDARSLGIAGFDVKLSGTTPHLALPLAGRFQLDNLATAATAVEVLVELGLAGSLESLSGVERVRWPGRLELVEGEPPFVLDSAHNSLAFSALAEFFRELPERNRRTLLFGASEPDKLVEGLRILGPHFASTYTVEGFFKSVTREHHDAIPKDIVPSPPFSSPRQALDRLRSLNPRPELVVVTGSVYLVGACRRLLRESGHESPHA
ncbi:MAG TPA: cyanophycin synthetase [Polyangiaceae bacterium]